MGGGTEQEAVENAALTGAHDDEVCRKSFCSGTDLMGGVAFYDFYRIRRDVVFSGTFHNCRPGRVDHFCLQVSSFEEEELLDYLKQHNITTSGFAERYGAQGYGRSVYVEDPEGNVVELKPFKMTTN